MAQNFSDKFTTTRRRSVYTDIRNNLQVHPGSKDVLLLSDADTVKNCIFNLLKTSPTERPFQPKLGSYLSKLLFEQMDLQTLMFAKQIIKDTISIYEPRAKVENVTISASPDENGLYITIVYSMLNTETPITIDLILDKVR